MGNCNATARFDAYSLHVLFIIDFFFQLFGDRLPVSSADLLGVGVLAAEVDEVAVAAVGLLPADALVADLPAQVRPLEMLQPLLGAAVRDRHIVAVRLEHPLHLPGHARDVEEAVVAT